MSDKQEQQKEKDYKTEYHKLEYSYKNLIKYIDDNYIPKQRIRDRIKELEDLRKDKFTSQTIECSDILLKELQDLLVSKAKEGNDKQ
jgi:hypothetical protein